MTKTSVNMTLHDLLVSRGNHSEAILAPGKQTVSYKQLHDNVIQLASALNSFGIGRGDRVAIAWEWPRNSN